MMRLARLALFTMAFAVHANAGDDPPDVLQRFFRTYAEGSLLAPFWSEAAPGREPFEKAARATLRTRCIELQAMRIDDVVVSGDVATANVSLLLTKRERATDRAWGPTPVDYGVALVRENNGWHIRNVTPAAQTLAEALIAAPAAEARTRLLSQGNLTSEVVRVLIRKAIAAANIPNLEEALRISAIAEDIATQIGDPGGLSLHLSLLSMAARTEGRWADTRALAGRALELARQTGDPDVLARALISAGRSYEQEPFGHPGPALFREAASLENRVEDLSLMVRAAIAMHLDAWTTKDYVLIRSLIDKALRLSEEAGDATGAAAAMQGLANLYDDLGEFVPCIEYSTRAADLFEEISPGESYLAALFTESRCRFQNGETKESGRLLDLALTLSRERNNEVQEAWVLAEMGGRLFDSGQYEEAERLSRQSIQLMRKHQAVPDGQYLILAWCLVEQKRFAEALDVARVYRSERMRSTDRELSIRTVEAQAHRGLGDVTAALRDLNEAMAASERLRDQLPGNEQQRATAFGNRFGVRELYDEAIDLNVELGRIGEALDIAERAKGRVLLEVLSDARRSTATMTADEEQSEHRLESELAAANRRLAHAESNGEAAAGLRAELDRVRAEYTTLESSLYGRHPRLRAQRGQVAVASLDQMAAILPTDGALVEYVVGSRRTHAFIVTRAPDGLPLLRCKVLPIGRRSLEEKVTAYRRQLAARNLTHRPAARELDAILFAPLGLVKRTVGIIPDGVLWQLPFETLIDAGGRYRLERHTLYYASSISVLREMMNKRPGVHDRSPRGTVLAVGDPFVAASARNNLAAVYRSADLSPLPDARVEVETIRTMYGRDAVTTYVGAVATEARVKAEIGRYDVLHFATHGILDDASPMYSRLVLAEDERASGSDADGMLEAWELMKLDIKGDLVVLSSCDSGRGRVSSGEGLIGLTWAVFVAGARTTVASIWKTASKSTAVLMVDFHRELCAHPFGPVAKAEALRRAKLRVLRDRAHRHPFYWAPFVVIGDPGRHQ